MLSGLDRFSLLMAMVKIFTLIYHKHAVSNEVQHNKIAQQICNYDLAKSCDRKTCLSNKCAKTFMC